MTPTMREMMTPHGLDYDRFVAYRDKVQRRVDNPFGPENRAVFRQEYRVLPQWLVEMIERKGVR